MSTILTNLTRLQNAKTGIANAITSAGGSLSTGKLEGFANDINNRCDYISDYIHGLLTSAKTRSVTVDFVNGTTIFSGDSISNMSNYTQMAKCTVADDGTITSYYGDGTYNGDGSIGQSMVKIPKFYYSVDARNANSGDIIDVGTWSISTKPQYGFQLHPAFIGRDGNELDYFMIGCFEALFQIPNTDTYTEQYNASYMLASMNGTGTASPAVSFTRSQGRTAASLRGNGWYQLGFTQLQAIQMLFAVEYGFNAQTAVGNGIVDVSSKQYIGTTDLDGNNTVGTTLNSYSSVSYRGIENLWGNVWSWVDGFVGNGGTGYFTTGYNYTDTYNSTGYQAIGFTLAATSGVRYTTRFGYDSNNPWIIYPHTESTTANPSGPIGDAVYSATASNRMLYFGGNWDDTTNAGMFFFDLYGASSFSANTLGSRLMYIPH